MDSSALARVIVQLTGLGEGPRFLVLDRTNWKLCRRDVNVLMLVVRALAVALAHATGQCRAKHRQIVIGTHTRRAQSIFRYGYDPLRKILFVDTLRAVQLWRCFIAGKTPEFSPHYSILRPSGT